MANYATRIHISCDFPAGRFPQHPTTFCTTQKIPAPSGNFSHPHDGFSWNLSHTEHLEIAQPCQHLRTKYSYNFQQLSFWNLHNDKRGRTFVSSYVLSGKWLDKGCWLESRYLQNRGLNIFFCTEGHQKAAIVLLLMWVARWEVSVREIFCLEMCHTSCSQLHRACFPALLPCTCWDWKQRNVVSWLKKACWWLINWKPSLLEAGHRLSAQLMDENSHMLTQISHNNTYRPFHTSKQRKSISPLCLSPNHAAGIPFIPLWKEQNEQKSKQKAMCAPTKVVSKWQRRNISQIKERGQSIKAEPVSVWMHGVGFLQYWTHENRTESAENSIELTQQKVNLKWNLSDPLQMNSHSWAAWRGIVDQQFVVWCVNGPKLSSGLTDHESESIMFRIVRLAKKAFRRRQGWVEGIPFEAGRSWTV